MIILFSKSHSHVKLALTLKINQSLYKKNIEEATFEFFEFQNFK
jgi:hypothetical protein